MVKKQSDRIMEKFCQFATISTNQVAKAMWSMGLYPTKSEVREILNEVDPDGKGTIDFPDFLNMMTRKMKDKNCKLNKSEKEIFMAAFMEMDLDGDGVINFDDLQLAMSNVGETLTDEEVAGMIREVDIDGDGVVSFEEFASLFTPRMAMEMKAEEREMFRTLDENGNGFVSAADARRVILTNFKRLKQEEVDAMIGEADVNGDGHVKYEVLLNQLSSD